MWRIGETCRPLALLRDEGDAALFSHPRLTVQRSNHHVPDRLYCKGERLIWLDTTGNTNNTQDRDVTHTLSLPLHKLGWNTTSFIHPQGPRANIPSYHFGA